MAKHACAVCPATITLDPVPGTEPRHIRRALALRAAKWQTGPDKLCERCKGRVVRGRDGEELVRLAARYPEKKKRTSGTPERVMRERHFAELAKGREAA